MEIPSLYWNGALVPHCIRSPIQNIRSRERLLPDAAQEIHSNFKALTSVSNLNFLLVAQTCSENFPPYLIYYNFYLPRVRFNWSSPIFGCQGRPLVLNTVLHLESPSTLIFHSSSYCLKLKLNICVRCIMALIDPMHHNNSSITCFLTLAFIEPIYRNKSNNTYLLAFLLIFQVYLLEAWWHHDAQLCGRLRDGHRLCHSATGLGARVWYTDAIF